MNIYKKDIGFKSITISTFICVILGVIIFVIDLMLPLGVAGGVPYIVVILVSLRSNHLKFTFYISIFCTLLTIIGYFYSPEGGELWKVLMNRALALFAIWVTALLSIKIIKESIKEIKTLQGLLPICMDCKNIRDDSGYWNKLEHYLSEHSEIELSHGLCDECMEKRCPSTDEDIYDK